MVATLYPDDKTGKLNALHAWWPAGIVVGGLLSVLFFKQLSLDWQALVALIMIPGVVFGLVGHAPRISRRPKAPRRACRSAR